MQITNCARRSSFQVAFGQGFDSPRLHQFYSSPRPLGLEYLFALFFWSPFSFAVSYVVSPEYHNRIVQFSQFDILAKCCRTFFRYKMYVTRQVRVSALLDLHQLTQVVRFLLQLLVLGSKPVYLPVLLGAGGILLHTVDNGIIL